MLSVFS